MRFLQLVGAGVCALLITACGGGGGNPGSSGGNGSQPAGTLNLQVVSGVAGTQTFSITASEKTAKAKIVLKDKGGAPVKNTIVTFSETGGSLLKFSPDSKTALTNTNGEAEIDIEPVSTTSIGATSVSATAQVSSEVVTGVQNLAVTSAVVIGVNPQLVASALNFISVDPSDKSIVIAGSGGNGRSESAILRFRVVDKDGNPVKDVLVDFAAVPTTAVTLNVPSAKSNADGIVATSVSSKSTPTAVIIRATVNSRDIVSQSDQLTVTTGVAVPRGFDLSASKFNLNNDISGDNSIIRIGIIDANGNPVSDGVPVIATVDFGRVGTSGRGGCTTVNGLCTVEYQVQNPRPADGQAVNVTVSTQVGNGVQISDTIRLSSTSVGNVDFYDATGAAVSTIALTASDLDPKCKATLRGQIGTPAGMPAPVGTNVELKSSSDIVVSSVTSGNPTLDSRSLTRTPVTLQFELKDALVSGRATIDFKFTAGTTVGSNVKTITFPACTPV